MNFIKDFFKGILIGIANIIPGVSGGTMAVSVGVYDRMILAITGLFSHLKQSIRTLLPIVIGMLAGIAGLSFVIKYLLENFPLQTSSLFIGMILGGIPILYTHVKGHRPGIPHAALFLIFFLLVILMAVVNGSESSVTDIRITPLTVIELFVVGVIASATMIIPGVSGSLVMMILGFYNIIISNISTFITSLVSFQLSGILHGIGVFLPFGIGVIVGIFAVANLIGWLFGHFPILTYSAIFGLIIASPFAILYDAGISAISIPGILVSLVALLAGFAITYFLGKEDTDKTP